MTKKKELEKAIARIDALERYAEYMSLCVSTLEMEVEELMFGKKKKKTKK